MKNKQEEQEVRKAVKKIDSGYVHGIVECQDCGYHYEGYKNALGVGANHAKHHGHRVTVDVGLSVVYQGVEL